MIPLVDLSAQYQTIKPEIDEAIQNVLTSGQFILGREVATFEAEVAHYLGVKYAIGVASGTDALILALRALGIGVGDEVILPAYTFFATLGAVLHVGAKPVLVDIDLQTYCMDLDQVEACITPATRAIIPVHLFGYPVNFTRLAKLADSYGGLRIVEDNAQAFGASYNGQKTGSFGDLGCLSFFPTKGLGAYGDGGMVVTNSEELAIEVRLLRSHGWQNKHYPETLGYNSRLDELQAAILRVKLRHVNEWNGHRRFLAYEYQQALSESLNLILPYQDSRASHVYHLYIIRSRKRDELLRLLTENNIAASVYYPQPLHLSKPCRGLGYQPGDFPTAERAALESLAIPFYPEITQEQVNKVWKTILSFRK